MSQLENSKGGNKWAATINRSLSPIRISTRRRNTMEKLAYPVSAGPMSNEVSVVTSDLNLDRNSR